MKTLFWILLFLFAAHGVTAPSARAVTPFVADKIHEAQAMLDAGNYQAAFTRYMDLLREFPDDLSVNVAAARTAKMAGKFNHSRMLYERLTGTLPDNAQLRLEYANLLLAMGKPEEARRELDEARRIDPAIQESKIGEAFQRMERHVRTVDWNLRLAGGVLYDSNMTTGPSLRGVEIGGLPITLDRTSTARESWGSYLHLAGDVAWRPNAETPWWLVADVSGYQRWYERTTPRRDLTFGRAAAGVRYLAGSTMAEARFKTDTLLENEETSVNLYGVEGTVIHALLADVHLSFKGGVEHRDDIATRGRSGTFGWGGPSVRYFFGDDKHSVMAGIKAYASATDQRRYGYSGFEPSLSLMLNLPWSTELIMSASWHNEDYKGGATILDGQNRRDTQWRGSVFAIKKLAESLRLEAGYQYTDNTSNSDLYNYTQHLVTVGLAFTF